MNNKKNTIITIFAITVLVITFISATYAYFTAQGGNTTSEDVSVTSNTTDLLTFQIGNDISFTASQSNFYQNGTNVSGSTTASATLTPNNKTNQGTMNYYMYLKLDSNPITYSSTNTNHDPELLLQVFDGSNQLVTLTNLGSQVTIGGLTGYDITGVSGVITLLNNHAIAANGSTTIENWSVVITLINLGVNQNDNTNKVVTGEVILRRTELGYCELNPTDFGCQVSLTYNPEVSNSIELTGTGIDGYLYHHDTTLTNGAGDGSYRYAGANPNNYVCFGSNASTCSADNIYRIIGLIPVDVVTDETTIPVTTERQMLYKIIKNDYLTTTEVSTGTASYNGLTPSTYNGPSGNQASSPQGYYWSGSSSNSSNTWSSSTLNTNGLNGSYLTNIGSTWDNKIATVMWKVGGGNEYYILKATPMSTVYTNEIIESGSHVTNAPTDGKNEYAAKVGLMYVSDYGYAASSMAWTYKLFNSYVNDYSLSTIVANNWLYRGITEWTISRCSNDTLAAYASLNAGGVGNERVFNRSFGVRPTFYLNSSTTIDMTNHAGTLDDPYRIS